MTSVLEDEVRASRIGLRDAARATSGHCRPGPLPGLKEAVSGRQK